jgi:hypothetical protein
MATNALQGLVVWTRAYIQIPHKQRAVRSLHTQSLFNNGLLRVYGLSSVAYRGWQSEKKKKKKEQKEQKEESSRSHPPEWFVSYR